IFGNYDKKLKVFILGWFLLAAIPASITQDVPHSVRTMNFLPMYPLLTTLGILGMAGMLAKKKIFVNLFVGLLVIVAGFNFLYYLNQYFVQQNYFNALDWQYGYP